MGFDPTARADYRGGGIVNLMSSLERALGRDANAYVPARLLPPSDIERFQHVVLWVIDGLGAEYLRARSDAPALKSDTIGTLSSVFPPTTASAITTFMTGEAPLQHGLIGWFVYLRELGMVTAVLPFTPRCGAADLEAAGVHPGDIFLSPSAFNGLSASPHVLLPENIVESAFTRAYSGAAERHAYADLPSLCNTVQQLANDRKNRNYVYAYWSELDSRAHRFGIGSAEVADHVASIDAAYAQLRAAIAGTDTLLIVTADHGFVDIEPEDWFDFSDHPELNRMLALPLSGEPRCAYCHARADARASFQSYCGEVLGGRATLISGDEFLREHYLGLGAAHPNLRDRVGDFVLLMHEGYAVRDRVLGEAQFKLRGVHGGQSNAELQVPLIVHRGGAR